MRPSLPTSPSQFPPPGLLAPARRHLPRPRFLPSGRPPLGCSPASPAGRLPLPALLLHLLSCTDSSRRSCVACSGRPAPPPPPSHGSRCGRPGGGEQLRRIPHTAAASAARRDARRGAGPDPAARKRSSVGVPPGRAPFTIELEASAGRRRPRWVAADCCYRWPEVGPHARCFVLRWRRASPEEGEGLRRRQTGTEGQISSVS